VSLRRCFRTRALEEAKRARKSDHDGVLFAVTLDPTRKKSAQKGASRG
jgi:electron transfer flavoprotein alpha/beta subunit